jgi:hypothetical protein
MVAEVIELDLMLLADDNAEKTVWLTLMDSAGNQSEPQAATVNVYTSATIPELTLSMTPAVPSPFAELAVKPGSALTLNGQVQIFGAPVYQSGFTIASAQLTMGDQLINLGDLVISETGNLTGSTTVPTLDSPPPDGTKLSATVIIEAPWGAASTPAYSNSLDFYGAGPAIITANLTGGGPCVADSTTQVELNATGASHARISGDILNGAQWISLPPGEQLLPIELTPGSGSKKLLLELSNPAGVTTATELLVLLDQTPPEILNLQVTLDGLAPPFAGDGNPILNQPSVALAVSAIDEPLCGPMNVIFGVWTMMPTVPSMKPSSHTRNLLLSPLPERMEQRVFQWHCAMRSETVRERPMTAGKKSLFISTGNLRYPRLCSCQTFCQGLSAVASSTSR